MQIAHYKEKNNSSEIQTLQRLFDALLAILWLWIGLVAFFVMAIWLEVGHFPSYGNPDPKDTLLGAFLPLIYLGFAATIVSTFLWTISAIAKVIGYVPLRINWQRIGLFLIAIASIWAILQTTGIMEWLLD